MRHRPPSWVQLAGALAICSLTAHHPAIAQADAPAIVHDAEYYILRAQHGDQWAAQDRELDAKLAELRQKYGAPRNIIHILFDSGS